MSTEVLLINASEAGGFVGQAMVCDGYILASKRHPRQAEARAIFDDAADRLRRELGGELVRRTLFVEPSAWDWGGLLHSAGIPGIARRDENMAVLRRKAGLPESVTMEIPQESYGTLHRLSARHGKTMGGIVGALAYFEEAVDEHYGEAGHGQAFLERCFELMEEAESKRLELNSQRKPAGPRM